MGVQLLYVLLQEPEYALEINLSVQSHSRRKHLELSTVCSWLLREDKICILRTVNDSVFYIENV